MLTPKNYAGLVASKKVEWGSSLALPASAGTVRLVLGRAAEAGLTLRRLVVIPAVAIGVDVTSTNFHTFRPFITTVRDGVASTRYLGTSRATNLLQVQADLPFRAHEEETFNEVLLKGTMVGIDIVTTGTPASVRALIQAELINVR